MGHEKKNAIITDHGSCWFIALFSIVLRCYFVAFQGI